MKTILALFCAAALHAGTAPLDSPTGNLGTSYSWGTVTAYGFNQQGQPADLYGVDQPFNHLPGDALNDQGLGIDNAPVCGGASPSTISTLPAYICQSIALDLQGGESIWFSGIDAIQFAAYYPRLADDWTVWGAQVLGGPKTWLFSGMDEVAYQIPPDFAYIVATGSNVLVADGLLAQPIPEPSAAGLVFFGLALLAVIFMRRGGLA